MTSVKNNPGLKRRFVPRLRSDLTRLFVVHTERTPLPRGVFSKKKQDMPVPVPCG